MPTNRIVEHYSSGVEYEWDRLSQDRYHQLEFDTTMHFVEEFIPESALVLDAGGGPGRYTLELARRGHKVFLVDLVEANLHMAKTKIAKAGLLNQIAGIEKGSITDLSIFASNTFDFVLCLGGPLSHVLNHADRLTAISELSRVAKPAAPVFISVIGRLAAIVTDLTHGQQELGLPHFSDLVATGDYDGDHGFTACHFYLPEDLVQDIERSGLTIEALAGLEGIGANHKDHINSLPANPEKWQAWYDMHIKTCTHPAVVGMSEHFMAISRKLSA